MVTVPWKTFRRLVNFWNFKKEIGKERLIFP